MNGASAYDEIGGALDRACYHLQTAAEIAAAIPSAGIKEDVERCLREVDRLTALLDALRDPCNHAVDNPNCSHYA
jgi:hypothetical protein